jgi:hypothetical protein
MEGGFGAARPSHCERRGSVASKRRAPRARLEHMEPNMKPYMEYVTSASPRGGHGFRIGVDVLVTSALIPT